MSLRCLCILKHQMISWPTSTLDEQEREGRREGREEGIQTCCFKPVQPIKPPGLDCSWRLSLPPLGSFVPLLPPRGRR